MRAILNTDGGARGNPGPGGIGVVLVDENDGVIGEFGRATGHTTNNIAEYEAVIAGLELALDAGVTDIEVRSDSKLVVFQVNGEWKIKKDNLRQLAVRVQGLMKRFDSATIVHVPREENARADELANEAMDEAEMQQPLRDEPGSLF